MKLIKTTEAAGHVLCHDMTQIIPGVTKDARFRKGHVVKKEDIPVLLSMGKENLYVFEMAEGFIHEDEAAEMLAELCYGEHMTKSAPKEGKIELKADCDGLFLVDRKRLAAVNSQDQLMIATRRGNVAVKKGDKLAGMRVIPLVIEREKLLRAAEICRQEAGGKGDPILRIVPFKLKKAAVIVTGSEVAKGLIEDKFGPVVEGKLAAFGVETVFRTKCVDDDETILAAINEARLCGAEIVLCTGGMSVDPDDRTPGAIKKSGARMVTYGAPTLPGAMLCLGYFKDGTPIMGLPGCVMYAKSTIFDILLPRVLAGVEITKEEIAELGYGGLCLGCPQCRFPDCSFGCGL